MRREWNEPRPRLPMQTPADHHIMAMLALLVAALFVAGMVCGALGLLPV